MSDKISSEDLISREWLKDAFDNLCCHNCKICRNFRNEDSFYKCALIENARAVERPQGEYEEGIQGHYCSICYKIDYSYYDHNYCPYCGARMRGNKE